MATYKIPDSPKKYKTEYSSFKGVDLSSNPTQVDSARGAMGTVNLISDSGGFPEKRKGWRVLLNVEKPVNGLYRGIIKGKEYFLVHGGTRLYKWTENTLTELKSGLTNKQGTSFTLNDKMYVLTGGGTSFENVNLLSDKRKNEFCADGSATTYQLDTTDIASIAEVKVDDKVWESSKYTLDKTKGQVKFTTAPPKPAITGKDNVVITFVKPVEGYKEKITKCTIAAIYGGKSQDRVFLAGNPDEQDKDWRCESNNPLYFSDLSYTKVGADGAAIVGYTAISDSQAIVKSDDRSETTIYFRGYSINDNTSAVQFPVRRATAGAGAVAKHAFAYLPEEPVFLSRTGVFALTSSNVTALQVARNRSYYVDAALTKEAHLENACAVVWNGYYVLAVNGHAYVLDTNQNVAYKPQSYGDYVYECYYWNNFPAVRMMESRGNLYFGTSDGRICKLNTDIDTMQAYSDGGTLGEDGRITGGTAISAEWHTKADDDGDFMTYKTMVKRGSGVMMKPYARSSVKVFARTERDFGRQIREQLIDIFSWEDIDFTRFTFFSNDAPQVVPFNSKVKKYKTMQLIIKNDALNEAFGIFGIIKRYTIGTSVR